MKKFKIGDKAQVREGQKPYGNDKVTIVDTWMSGGVQICEYYYDGTFVKSFSDTSNLIPLN